MRAVRSTGPPCCLEARWERRSTCGRPRCRRSRCATEWSASTIAGTVAPDAGGPVRDRRSRRRRARAARRSLSSGCPMPACRSRAWWPVAGRACPGANRAPHLHLQLGISAARAGLGGSRRGGDGGRQRRRRRRRRARALVHARLRPVAPEVLGWVGAMLRATPPQGYVGCCAAIEHLDLRGDLESIVAPTLAVGAAGDLAIPPEHSRRSLPPSRARLESFRTARISPRSSAPTRSQS